MLSNLQMKKPVAETSNASPEVNTSTDDTAVRKHTTMMLLKRSLAKHKEFPAMGNSIAEIMQVVEGHGCAEELAEIILREQSLSSKVLSRVNSSGYGQFGGEIKTISRAVIILGLTQVQNMCISIMVFEKLNNGPMAEILKSNTCQSFLSAIFAKKLTKKSPSVNSEEAFLASMFHNLGKQITIYFLPDEYNNIMDLIIEKGIDEDEATRKILDVNFASIGQFIAIGWKLPKNIILGIQPKPLRIAQKPAKPEDFLAQISSLTNEIVQAAACGDHEQAKAELQHIINRYKVSFSLSYEKVTQILKILFDELISHCEALGIDPHKNTFCKNFISFTMHNHDFKEFETTGTTPGETSL
tara:strand:+ start:4603 stop:5670 length:1068 start_codon:yes stop_codon:yes gene_type:complete